VIEALNLCKRFQDKKRGEVRAVDGVSFTCRAGEIYGLLGANGAGKTTTLRMLATILEPTEGTARLCGHDIVEHPERVRANCGFLSTATALYPRLAPIANGWNAAMDIAVRYPETHEAFLRRCHTAGQKKPTPLLLQYGEGDYNCLHQDLYGEHVFPLQVAILLSEPGEDFSGGEFVLTEQRPRMQSRPLVMDLRKGDALIFAVNQRPVKGVRGDYRVTMRHGVSRLHSGKRHTLGIIFHDAR